MLLLLVAAVREQFAVGDVAALVRGEKEHRAGYFLGPPGGEDERVLGGEPLRCCSADS